MRAVEAVRRPTESKGAVPLLGNVHKKIRNQIVAESESVDLEREAWVLILVLADLRQELFAGFWSIVWAAICEDKHCAGSSLGRCTSRVTLSE